MGCGMDVFLRVQSTILKFSDEDTIEGLWLPQLHHTSSPGTMYR